MLDIGTEQQSSHGKFEPGRGLRLEPHRADVDPAVSHGSAVSHGDDGSTCEAAVP